MIVLAGFGAGLFIASLLETMSGRYRIVSAVGLAVLVFATLSLLPAHDGVKAVAGLVVGAFLAMVLASRIANRIWGSGS